MKPVRAPLRHPGPLAYEKLSDPILVRRAKDGDDAALAALAERHAPRVERLARHLLGDGEEARDAAQDALAKLCARVGQYRGDSQFGTWLHRLTVNTCKDAAERAARRRCEPLEEDRRIAPDADDPAQEAARSELRGELSAQLAGIAPAQARVLVMKDGFDFSFEEIAAAADMPVGTAKCYAHRARARIRERMEAAA